MPPSTRFLAAISFLVSFAFSLNAQAQVRNECEYRHKHASHTSHDEKSNKYTNESHSSHPEDNDPANESYATNSIKDFYIGLSHRLGIFNDADVFRIAHENALNVDTGSALTFKNSTSDSSVILKQNGTYKSEILNGEVSFGYQLTRNIALELGAAYLSLENENATYVELQRVRNFFANSATLSPEEEAVRSLDPNSPLAVAFKLHDDGIDLGTFMLSSVFSTNISDQVGLYAAIGGGLVIADFLRTSNNSLGYQLGGGVKFKASDHISFAIGYKFTAVPHLNLEEVNPITDIPLLSDNLPGVAHTIVPSGTAIITNGVFIHGIELKCIYIF